MIDMQLSRVANHCELLRILATDQDALPGVRCGVAQEPRAGPQQRSSALPRLAPAWQVVADLLPICCRFVADLFPLLWPLLLPY
jgi:hypothetical protein